MLRGHACVSGFRRPRRTMMGFPDLWQRTHGESRWQSLGWMRAGPRWRRVTRGSYFPLVANVVSRCAAGAMLEVNTQRLLCVLSSTLSVVCSYTPN
ncbi:hypothetical protein NDU88_006421 [Pleurodeles waltl]|uniref:Uncharacterized protein n=1 Tax=Pleurodeles waltl TaxID=8319 RepID=A0AAV7VLY1_PLEWA|nr:hypothetical protein NDU88_006421 [Pleurodeles waltl]